MGLAGVEPPARGVNKHTPKQEQVKSTAYRSLAQFLQIPYPCVSPSGENHY